MYLVCYKGDGIFDSCIKIFRPGEQYTHVGIALDKPEKDTITYYASREDKGVAEYTESLTDVDLYELNNPRVKSVTKVFKKTKGMKGSFITDCGYRYLKEKDSIGNEEWCALALDLGYPEKYKIRDLIDFANIKI